MSINDSVSRKQLLKKETLGFMWHHPSLPGMVMSGLVLWLGREAKDAKKHEDLNLKWQSYNIWHWEKVTLKHKQNMTHIWERVK